MQDDDDAFGEGMPKDKIPAPKAPKGGGGKSKGMKMPKAKAPSKITAKGHAGHAKPPKELFKPQQPIRSKGRKK